MAKENKKDDLEAVRILIDALTPFDDSERSRIIRWAGEKLGLTTSTVPHQPIATEPRLGDPIPLETNAALGRPAKDIKSFIDEKDPKNDQQLAAVVAYYYAFEVSEEERKDSIRFKDLIDACRLAQRNRPKDPTQTLINAAHSGFLDKAEGAGMYRLNAVGENLVAMTLPGGKQSERKRGKPSIKGKKVAKKLK